MERVRDLLLICPLGIQNLNLLVTSFLLGFLGKFPEKKVIQTSHTAELAVGFGRKVRNLVDSDIYKSIFPGVGLQADSQRQQVVGRLIRAEITLQSVLAERLLVKALISSLLTIRTQNKRQHLSREPTQRCTTRRTSGIHLVQGSVYSLVASIIIVMTRWSKKDLTAQVVKADAQQRSGEGVGSH